MSLNRAILAGAVVALVWPLARVGAQRTATTSLVVQVAPEAHLNPSQVELQFVVSGDVAGDVTSQAAAIDAWVRVLPGQRIRLLAHIASLSGPSGAIPASAIRWSGSNTHATWGGQTAVCAGGSFAGGASQDLVAGWQRSGTLGCAVTFSLADPRSLAAGVYTGVVDLALRAE